MNCTPKVGHQLWGVFYCLNSTSIVTPLPLYSGEQFNYATSDLKRLNLIKINLALVFYQLVLLNILPNLKCHHTE